MTDLVATRPRPAAPAGGRHRIDLERLVLVPILSGLLFLNVLAAGRYVREAESLSLLTVLTGTYKALIVSFYILLIVLLLIRTAAQDSDRNPTAVVMAYLGSFGPMVLLGLGGTGNAGSLVTLTSVVIMTAGMVFSIYSVSYLGRSFGAIPRARGLVTSGPYRTVRHPLYVGEFVVLIGAVLVDLSAFKFVVLVLVVAVQAYRARQEERVLSGVFPEYQEYSRRTSRFVPGVV